MAAIPAPTVAPAVFVGHGSPMNAIEQTPYAAHWRSFGDRIARPRGIVAVSAHWYTQGTAVTVNARPRTIHDFGGFPPALYAVNYPAPGDPALAARVIECLQPTEVCASSDWGLDHGTWSVLVHLYPHADVPVVQLSIDAALPPSAHYDLGRRLGRLREEGILILGSGNIVHNLGRADWRANAPAQPWAREFDGRIARAVLAGDHATAIAYEDLGEAARLSVPTAEHYLPLLYVLGAQRAGEAATVSLQDVVLGSISMTMVTLGARSAAQ